MHPRRFVGVKNGNIFVVATEHFEDCIVVPEELNSISAEKLILQYKVIDNKFITKHKHKHAKDMKVAFISNYNQKCGISSYFEALGPEIVKHIKDFKIFAEHVENKTNIEVFNENKISYCWNRAKSLDKLVDEVKTYNPDIIVINHEFGIFPDAKHWLSLMRQLSEFRVIVIMHSVFPNHNDKIVIEASIPEIIVHLEKAEDALKHVKQVPGKVHVIPHGCHNFDNKPK